ncbi:GrxA family glutaredoxin [Marinobacterium sedimentorum]|uniref:GrxA family glutaredoxin n=1 Tax=Marinobacterium sedimentorum TaxID=2927804 RepID=UPI0020C63290|nr:GrxA family glutaredoxin [Marinobacterium sedimentorum]MCP8687824.1 GrxA family glutaredoxin [Marinobacterium sedimentorum]
MERITIFGREGCGYCRRAKELCDIKSLNYRYIDIQREGISKADLEKTIGKPVITVPQIFHGQQHIGGYTEFARLLQQTQA